jgi:hypothetical protein
MIAMTTRSRLAIGSSAHSTSKMTSGPTPHSAPANDCTNCSNGKPNTNATTTAVMASRCSTPPEPAAGRGHLNWPQCGRLKWPHLRPIGC